MEWPLLLFLQIMFQPSLAVLFTVEAERTTYEAEFEGDVVMSCKFQPKLIHPHDNLKVTWQRLYSGKSREVYRIDNRAEQLSSQDSDYRGRVRLLAEELNQGWARLQISRLRINDSGKYQCLVQTGEEVDYKKIELSVIAPYKNVNKSIQKKGDQVQLSCKSKGYPNSSVVWLDGHQQRLNSSTTVDVTPQQLFEITSEIVIPLSDRTNYTCIFGKEGYSATFHIPDDVPMPHEKSDGLIIALCTGLVMLAIVVGVLLYRRRKGHAPHTNRNHFFRDRSSSFSAADWSPEDGANPS